MPDDSARSHDMPPSPMMVDRDGIGHHHGNDKQLSSPVEDAGDGPKFVADERVFCPEKDGLIYEAVVKKTAFRASENPPQWKYQVHYLGWNSRWDRWLSAAEIRADDDETRELMAEQKRKQQETIANNKRMQTQHQHQGYTKNSVAKRRRMGTGDVGLNNAGGGGATRSAPSVWAEYCDLPFTLKTILVDDRERIMRLGFDSPHHQYDCDISRWKPSRDVHHLPASVTIQQVLNHYVRVQKSKSDDEHQASKAEANARTFVSELTDIFEEALPVCLLYNPERAQYVASKNNLNFQGKKLVEIYGCDYLLRLFTRLPALLDSSVGVSGPKRRKDFGSHLSNMIVLLQKNRSVCFKPNYRAPLDEELNDWEITLRDASAKKHAMAIEP